MNNLSKNNSSKNILVFNTACFGDVLLCNSLVQNIKQVFPDSKVIFVCDKNWIDVAKYQEGVDEVLIYDKNGKHKGIFGLLKFIKDFPYKRPFISFITYPNFRNTLISILLRSKHTKQQKKVDGKTPIQEEHANLLKPYTNKAITNLPIKFNIPQIDNDVININSEYVVLCTTSKASFKDMPIPIAIDLINKINTNTNYKVVFTGVGDKALNYAKELNSANCDFIDLVNKTSLIELSKVLKNAKCLISVDTGTMHLGLAVKTPTVSIFYKDDTVKLWSPNPNLYKSVVISKEQTSANIFKGFKNLLGEESHG